MTILTLLRFLIGDREAILRIAANRHSLWIGLLFVLSAGFAREYDGEDLWHEPWYLLLPLGASLLSSLLLFTIAYGVAIIKGEPWNAFFSRYLSFLALFWMTAPLAWFYGNPYERFLSPFDATRMNLFTLAFVSLWRVALMVRVFVVLFRFSLPAALCLVMVFADALALFLLTFLPFPLIDVMGGVHMTGNERLLRAVAGDVLVLGGCSLPLWMMFGGIALAHTTVDWAGAPPRFERPGNSLIVLAIVSILAWLPILPFTQPEQQRRREVERAFQREGFAKALSVMSGYSEADFPPGWRVPGPRLMRFYLDEQWVEMVKHLAAEDVAPWVRRRYIERVADILENLHMWDESVLHELGKALVRLPEAEEVIASLKRRESKQEILDGLEGKRGKEKSGK